MLVADLADRGDFGGGSGDEDFLGLADILERDVAFDDVEIAGLGERDDGAARDAVEEAIGRWGVELAVDDEEDVGAGGLADIAVPGQHQGVVKALGFGGVFGERADHVEAGGFRGDVRSLFKSRAFIGYVLCQVLASQIIFTFAGGGPYIVVMQMGRSSAEYGAWFATTGFAYLIGNLFCVRFAPRHSLEKLIWFGLALQLLGSLLNLVWGIAGLNQTPSWLFGTQMLVMFANAFVMSNSTAGAISVRPEAAGTASGAMGFLQMGLGSFLSQFGAYLGGHFTTPVPLNAAVFILSIACASTMVFLVPRRTVVVSEQLIEQAEEEESGML